EVYTPQVVVNGAYHVLGSDKVAIEHMIAKSHQNPSTLSVPVMLSVANGKLTIALSQAAELVPPAEVWVLGLAKAVTVAIKRGENKGKPITYHNVARRGLRLDPASGKKNWTVPFDEIDADGVSNAAVMVQSGTAERPGLMLGAAMASLR